MPVNNDFVTINSIFQNHWSEFKGKYKGSLRNIEIKEEIKVTSESNIEDFYGKPSVILFGGTYCGHCQKTVPIFKEKVYDVYSNDINIWINVVDNKKFNFEDIAQGLNSNLNFNEITGTECNYVPSWVILNEKGDVTLSSCGGEKDMEDMIETIGALI